jgi:hypothetical protein
VSLTPAVGVAATRVRRLSPSVFTLVAVALAAVVAWLAMGVTGVSAAPNSLPLRATYDVSANINWSNGTLAVSSTARVTNTTDNAVRALTFNLVTLRTGAATITAAKVAGEPVRAQTSGQIVVVPLPSPLAPGARVSVRIDYTARFNAYNGEKRDLFIKKDGIVTAYRWIPWLGREQRFSSPNFAETWVTGVSPRVTVRLTSGAGLKYATTGRWAGSSGTTATFVANDVRDFNFSASPNYRVRRVDWNGVKIHVYTQRLNSDALVSHTLAAMRRFSDRVGAYPYARYVVAETPAGSGMESPMMSWVSSSLSGSRLRHIVVHEAAHQWFYGVVGNNQARYAFVDEAVGDFLTRDMLGTFRPSECARDRLDRNVYDYSDRCYPEVIYVQGANYLRAYRDEVGAEKFWAGLSRFYREKRFGLAGTRALLNALDRASGFNSARHAERFPSLY